MALKLSKAGISINGTIQDYHVSQSIDALNGTEAYNITLSGSLNLTGSVVTGSFTGSLLGAATSASTITSLKYIGPINSTSSYFMTGSLTAGSASLNVDPSIIGSKTLGVDLFIMVNKYGAAAAPLSPPFVREVNTAGNPCTVSIRSNNADISPFYIQIFTL